MDENTLPEEENNNETAEEQESETTDPVAALEAEIAQLKDNWMRSVADTENVRKRAEREKQEASKYAATNFARDMLSVSDNMQRALESTPEGEDLPESVKSLVSGIQMVQQELLSIFERQGIKTVSPMGEKFDPNLHQAMFEVESVEHEPGTIIEVVQSGYTYHDRLLRAAMVGVAKAKK